MKKYLLICLLFLPSAVFAINDAFKIDSSTNSRILTVQNNGYVGIGTTSPSYKLSFGASLYSTGSILALYEGSGGSDKYGFGVTTNSVDFYAGGAHTASFKKSYGSYSAKFVVGSSYLTTGAPSVSAPSNGLLVQGSVGIGTTSPSQKLSVAGNVLADGYIEYSPFYIGDALSQIKNIKPETASLKSDSSWAKIDHLSLPDGVRYEQNIIWPAVYATTTKEIFNPETLSTTTEEIYDYKKLISATSTELFIGRDLGKQVQFNLRAIQQLLEKVEFLEAKIRLLEAQK